MGFHCHTCGRNFDELKGLSTHKRFCKVSHKREKADSKGPGLESALKRTRHTHSSQDPELDANKGTSMVVTDIAPDMEVTPESPPVSVSFSGQRRKAPRALKDYLPHSLVGLPLHLRPPPPRSMPPTESEAPSQVPAPDPEPEADSEFTTEPNGFGLYRQYIRKPRADPEDNARLGDLVDDSMPEQSQSEASLTETPPATSVDFFYPFPNETVYRCAKWFLGASGTLSTAEFDRLIRDVILSDGFNPEDLRNFSAAQELARLDQYGTTDVPFTAKDGWKNGSVTLHLPKSGRGYASESVAPQFCVSGIYYCPLMEVIKAACQSSQARKYHWVPFRLVHQSQEEHMRAYTDIYNSDAMLKEDAKIKALGQHPEDDPDTEVAIMAMLLWSDSTHLASFGTVSLWPVYLYFGNLSKYARGRPKAHATHHLAYIPSVSSYLLHVYKTAYPSHSLSFLTLSRTIMGRNMEPRQQTKF